jgi:hypothetical protein
MRVDAHNLYSDAQALTASAASTNIIDHGSRRDIGDGEPMALVVALDVASDGTTGNETYTAKLQTDSDSGFGTVTDVTPEYTIPKSSAAGAYYIIPLPPGVAVKRYTRAYYTLGGTTPTVTLTAFLSALNMVSRLAGPKLYPDAVTISS